MTKRDDQVERQSQTKAGQQVTRDEQDAEVAYQHHLKAAQRFAQMIAEGREYSESKRAAAAAVVTLLPKIEEARVQAEVEPTPDVAQRTFWQKLFSAR